jgi:hypothetical protein
MPGWDNRHYTPGEKPHEILSSLKGPNKLNRYFYLKIGRIVDIDYDQYKFKVEWLSGSGSPGWIPIHFAYAGPGGCIGAMPEIGANVICGYVDQGTLGMGSPISVAYLSPGLQTALDFNAVQRMPDSIPTDEQNIFYYKFRKMQKGDVVMTSSEGGHIFVNHDIEIKDNLLDTILMRSSDQSIISTSLNNFIFANGVSISSGQIIRNKVVIFDAYGNRLPNQLARELSLPDGRDHIYYVPHGDPIDEKSQFYSEYRIDVSDLVNGSLDINEINSQSSLTNKTPIVTLAMGNYVGSYDIRNDYGKMLRPVLFQDADDFNGQFEMVECDQFNGVDEPGTIGTAFAIHLLENDSFMGFDKEGHFYLNMNASTTANPLGSGRSMSILGTGNLKEIWGQDAEEGLSWDLSTTGGVRWNIGNANDTENSRSIDINASSGIKIEVQSQDAENYACQEIYNGNKSETINGSEQFYVIGNSDSTVQGLRREQIYGAVSLECHGTKTDSCLDTYTQIVVKEMQGKFGSRSETVLNGQDLTITSGNKSETLVLGNLLTTITAGNLTETLTAGNRTTNIVTGNYSVSTGVGNVSLTAATGAVNLTGTTKINATSAAVINLNAPKVNLGINPIRGGALVGLPGIPSCQCYITGLPYKGSATISASI